MKIAIVTVVLALVGIVGCSTNPCNRESACPNDTPQTQAQKDQCNASLDANKASECYSELLAYTNCYIDAQVCGGDGKTDGKATATKAENNCKNQKADAVACCTKNPSATACKG